MKIYLTTIINSEENEVELYYQTLKSYEEHSEDVRNFIESLIGKTSPVEELFTDGGTVPRLDKQVFQINETLKIARIYEYQYSATHEKNGVINNIKHSYYGS